MLICNGEKSCVCAFGQPTTMFSSQIRRLQSPDIRPKAHTQIRYMSQTGQLPERAQKSSAFRFTELVHGLCMALVAMVPKG